MRKFLMNKQVAYTEKLGINFLKKDTMPENYFTSKTHEGIKKFTTSSTFDGSLYHSQYELEIWHYVS